MQKNDDHDQSGFLEAPFVRMLRMRSASLKKIEATVSYTVNQKKTDETHKEIRSIFFPLPYEDSSRAVIGVK